MSSHHLSQEDARAIARVLYAVHQRRAAHAATHEDTSDSDARAATSAAGDVE